MRILVTNPSILRDLALLSQSVGSALTNRLHISLYSPLLGFDKIIEDHINAANHYLDRVESKV
jgi:hypothetical protein